MPESGPLRKRKPLGSQADWVEVPASTVMFLNLFAVDLTAWYFFRDNPIVQTLFIPIRFVELGCLIATIIAVRYRVKSRKKEREQ